MQHTEPAYPPAPLQGPPPGLLRPRSGLTAGVGFEDPARTLTRSTLPVMSATGPDRMFRFLAVTRTSRKRLPARWLALHGHLRPPASGAPMASASCLDLPHVSADPDRPSSRLVRYVRDPSGSGSGRSMARGWKVGMKTGAGFGQGVGIVGGWVWVCAPWSPHTPSCRTPIRHPAGERLRAGRLEMRS